MAAPLICPLILLAGCGGDGGSGGGSSSVNTYALAPAFMAGEPVRTDYDGSSAGLVTGVTRNLADLLTYTLGNNTAPKAAELRTLAIKDSYAQLLDVSAGGGFGVYFGTLDSRANKGVEYVTRSDDGSGTQNVSMVVQIPSHFDVNQPCLVVTPSDGSRGVYDSIATTGEWALNKGCAVAYTDKGAATIGHDLDADASYTITGERVAAGTRKDLLFNANLTGDDLSTYKTANPNRFALKHAHSKQNPEKDWGGYTHQAVLIAYYVLNKHFQGKSFTPGNTLVIANGVSNGGGAVLRALEHDASGLINGVVASEPQVSLPTTAALTVKRNGVQIPNAGKPILDYFTYANLYQACATQAPSLSPTNWFVAPATAANRCTALANLGLVSGNTTAERGADALARLRAYGWEPEHDLLHDSHFGFEFTNLVATTFANAYARASVKEALCGYSAGGLFGSATTPSRPSAAALAQLWATGGGLFYAGNAIDIVNDLAVGGPTKDTVSLTASTGKADFNIDGAACLRRLATNSAVGNTPITTAEADIANRIKNGAAQVAVNGNLRGKPAIIVHGRSDNLLPVNHTSRPYTAFNRQQESGSQLRYYEVANANHFDALVTFYPSVLVPLQYYNLQALELMYRHLKSGTALPPSQVVRGVPRANASATLTTTNVPPIAVNPAASDTIAITAGSIDVPN